MHTKTLRFYSNTPGLKQLLLQKGMSDEAAFRYARHFVTLADRLLESGVASDVKAFGYWVPGRIEVMGKHTDYGGGLSLLAALERGFCMLAVAEPDKNSGTPGLILMDCHRKKRLAIHREDETILNPSWAVYPQTVLNRGCENFGNLKVGGKLAFKSDLPRASGMSSSSALLIAIFMALRDLNGWDKTEAYTSTIKSNIDLADYLGHVENGQTYKTLAGEKGVGTFGGSQDHAAILCSKPNHVAEVSFKHTQLQASITIPDDLVFCLASSGVKASKAGGAREQYNDAARRAERVVAAWNAWKQQDVHSLAEVIRHPEFELDAFCKHLQLKAEGISLANRLLQFHAEVMQFIPDVKTALQINDLALLSKAVRRSQELAEIYLGNQVPETIYLAKSARALGAVAASAFGAGYGGSVWALVEAEAHDRFRDAWRTGYEAAFPQYASRAAFFVDPTGPAAFSIR